MDVRVTEIWGTHDEIDALVMAARLNNLWSDAGMYVKDSFGTLDTRRVVLSAFAHTSLQRWNQLCELAIKLGAHDVKNN